jgi:hypothetical protein
MNQNQQKQTNPERGLSLILPDTINNENGNGSAKIFNINPEVDRNEEKDRVFETELRAMIERTPKPIKAICNRFSSKDEMLMALFATTVLTGAILPNVKIKYHNKTNYPALMLLVIYPPASGKGCLSMIRKVTGKINTEMNRVNQETKKQYKFKCDQYKKALKAGSVDLPPDKPLLPMLLLSGDVTAPMLIQQLSDNGPEQPLLIYETEADALGNSTSNKQYGSQISTILRKAYEFETVSQARKTENELLITETPKLVMVLSGTENQITKIFNSNEDGLYSRFTIITGSSSPKWMNVRPDETNGSQDDFFEKMAELYYEMWKHFKDKEIEVKFTDEQWDRINIFGKKNLGINHNFIGEQTDSIAIRNANTIVRFAAILTVVNEHDNGRSESEVYCDDVDFDTAIWMAGQSLKSSMEIYKKLPAKGKALDGVNKMLLLKGLPEYFKTGEIPKLVPTVKIHPRTQTRVLSDFVASGYLLKVAHGQYQKTALAYLTLSELEGQDQ